MDPEEIENILNGGEGDGSYAHLARLIQRAQAPATASELAREDLAVAAFRRLAPVRSSRRERVLSRFTPLKVAVAAAAFVVAGGGFTAALTHAFTHAPAHPTTSTVPAKASDKVGTVSKAASSSNGTSSPKPSTGKGESKTSSGSKTTPSTTGSSQGKKSPDGKQNGKSKQNKQAKGTAIAPGLTGSAVPASYRGLCVSYSKAVTTLQSSSKTATKAPKLQSSQRFLRLAESALNQGLTVPQFCSDILGTKVPSLSLPGSGQGSASATGNGATAGSSSGSNKSDSGGDSS
ncbi:hypothetical protein [Ferrimicrobium acidiphilum]|uniref:hypothetical protein n=1 Tax=Ferrimicrobium acidiphilum TaxID=121039 RepID=UPI0023F302A9|nr:hypothetical protein [Ferrimicrobium acidiphilum]